MPNDGYKISGVVYGVGGTSLTVTKTSEDPLVVTVKVVGNGYEDLSIIPDELSLIVNTICDRPYI